MSAFAVCRSTVSKPFGKPVVDRLEKRDRVAGTALITQ